MLAHAEPKFLSANVRNSDDRIINLAAKHIEFAPTTEHNRF